MPPSSDTSLRGETKMTLETFTAKVNALGRESLETYVLECGLAPMEISEFAELWFSKKTDADLRALILTEPGDVASLDEDADLADWSL